MTLEQLEARVMTKEPSLETLRQLLRAWLFEQPFHNLDLLAGGVRAPPLTEDEAIARCKARLGGPCHVQAAGFGALLRSLGFQATLSGAQISSPDDHLLVRVAFDGRVWLCDVGNGQPYVEPFPTDFPIAFEHLGWSFETRQHVDGVELRRSSPDQPEARLVYRASLAPRRWSDFETTIARHHSEPGFGPFLRGLRAVRMSADEMLVLRDTTLTSFRKEGWQRTEVGLDDLPAVLRDRFRLAALPVDEAVAAWRSTRESSA